MLEKIRKRDGRLVPYDRSKIATAIFKAAQAVGGGDRERAEKLAEEVEELLITRFGEREIPGVEDIQDLVEKVLIERGHARTAKAYILYRQQHAEWRSLERLLLDVEKTVHRYLEGESWRINENSNMDYSLQGLNNHIIGAVTSRYWLEKVYPPAIRDAHVSGDLHLHDLSLLAPYCCGWDLGDLLEQGFKGAAQKVESAPAKHFRTALGQIANFFYTLQGEAAGAQALASFDTYLAPFIRYDGLSYKEVKQALQEFIFNLNVPTRVGFQTPFVNLTFDVRPPETMRGEPVIIGGRRQDAVYGDFQAEMDMLNMAFCEVMTEGDAKGRIFTFPIPTYNITKDFPWGTPVADKIMAMTAKYGIPYFANFINSEMKPEDVRSMCPLHPDTKVPVRTSKGLTIRPIREVYNTVVRAGTEYEVLINGKWIKAGLVVNDTVGCVKVKTSNGAETIMDLRHEQLAKAGKGAPVQLLTARDLKPGMYLPYNAVPLPEDKENYDAGFAVGAYLGDGSIDNKGGNLTFSLNDSESKQYATERLTTFFTRMGFICTESSEHNVHSLHVYGDKPSQAAIIWLRQFVTGDDARTKRLTPRAFRLGRSFLQGILDGWYATDGGNRGRIYTVNKGLVEDFQAICALLGLAYRVDLENPDQREGRLGDAPVYVAKFHTRPSYGDVFFKEDGYWWFKVEAVEPVDYSGKVYCFAVESEDHLFQLANGLVTHNCRLRLDNRELRRRGGGLFGANPLTGSIGVVTINLPRLGYLARSEEMFFSLLTRQMNLAKESLLLKRKALERFTEQGLYPYSRFYLRHVKEAFGRYWENHFNTIGIVGMHEAALNLLGVGVDTAAGREFALRVLDFMREKLRDFQEETGELFNLEATPAEGTSYRLARLDKELYPDIITSGEKEPYYTNSTQLPVNHGLDLFTALEHQDELQVKYTGGTVFHAFLGERLTDIKTCEQVIRTVFNNFRLPYFSLTPTFSVCPEHGYLVGEQPSCPECGAETEIWSRVVGYYRPVKNWNKGKKEEFRQRCTFRVEPEVAAQAAAGSE
ncbi:MAG: hypothetical protein PWQ41_1323 [Bacillota bacterium]|nr:hypothetical protein [Bacillota bacterium]MDK2856384.1 hypothetical protein [Bacillota bacterium]MDK2925549.1 hypothetical protein [Bacillota bacterium]